MTTQNLNYGYNLATARITQEITEELLTMQQVPGIRELRWDDVVARVQEHEDFPDALAELARGDCHILRELTRDAAEALVSQHLNKGKGQ